MQGKGGFGLTTSFDGGLGAIGAAEDNNNFIYGIAIAGTVPM